MSGAAGWLVAAVLIGLVVPFTFIGIMPTNKSLLLSGRDLASPDTRALLERWGRLHAVRTALSLSIHTTNAARGGTWRELPGIARILGKGGGSAGIHRRTPRSWYVPSGRLAA
jgi:hypothetical protein